jgi:hypothetical protein
VLLYRDDWIRRVHRRREAVPLDVTKYDITVPNIRKPSLKESSSPADLDIGLLLSLPSRRLAAYHRAQPKWEGSTADMIEGNGIVIAELESILVELGSLYPAGHFDGRRADDYIKHLIPEIAQWHRWCLEPHGSGTGGTILGPMTGGQLIVSLERMVEDLVHGLTSFRDDFNFHAWRQAWRESA